MKKPDDDRALQELISKAVSVAVTAAEERFSERLKGHVHRDLLDPHGTPAELAEEDPEEVLYQQRYDIKLHAHISILRQKQLDNRQIARWLNEERGETCWTEARVRIFFARAIGIDYRAFPRDRVKAELDKQAELEKWAVNRPAVKRMDRYGRAIDEVLVRPTQPGEIWQGEHQGLTVREMAKVMSVDEEDLKLFIAANRKYIDALSWK
jgi:hypothetical protein